MPDRSICAKATFMFNGALLQGKIELFSLLPKFCLQCEISIFQGGGPGEAAKAERGKSVHGQGPPGSISTQNLRVSGQAALRGRARGLALIALGRGPWHPRRARNPSVGLKLG